MPRRVEDIIPSGRRSIRNIPLSGKEDAPRVSRASRKREEVEDTEKISVHKAAIQEKRAADEGLVLEKQSAKPQRSKKAHRFPWTIFTIGAVVALAGAAFFVSSHFATATFTLVQRSVPAKVSGTYVIPPAVGTSFGYEIITLTGTASTSISASVGPYTESKAQGKVTVYNAYSSQAQKLVAGTRIVAASGLVYRLTSSIVIPGYKKSGSTITPGSIKTTIIAEKAGSEYNVGGGDVISDLRIAAYKGSAKYDAFYVRLASDISGGFAGTKTVISQNALSSTTADLQETLSSDLERKLLGALPEGYVMYPHSVLVSFGKASIDPLASSASTSARIKLDGTAQAIIFKKASLARFLAGASSTSVFGQLGYDAPGLDELSFSMTNQKDFSVAKKSPVTARISGSFELVGAIPEKDLKSAVAGASLSQTQSILKKYSSVIELSKSGAEVNPPWVTTIPKDQNRISIVIK